MQHRLRPIALVTAVAAMLAVAAGSRAALCVWLKPDRDIKEFFPGAGSYSTEVKRPSREQQSAIEQRIGGKLDPDENEFRFYRVNKGKTVVGTVLTHQARGRYGAVQVVVAMGNDRRVLGVHVQRHREPTNLNAPAFLRQFVGKSAADAFALGKDVDAIKGHEVSSQAVAFSVKKIVVVYDVLDKDK